jgi:hypothetical protein
MNCSLCKLKEIVINTSTTQGKTPEGGQTGYAGNIAHRHNDNYYCEECYEAIEFAGDMSSVSKKEIIVKEKENFTPKPVIKVAQTITVRCPKCKICYNGDACPDCKMPSPLSRGRK